MTTAMPTNDDTFQAVHDDNEDAFSAYKENFDGDYNDFQNRYQGEYESEEDDTEQLVEDTGMLAGVPDNLKYYFDYKAFARDLFIGDYTFNNGFVFSNY